MLTIVLWLWGKNSGPGHRWDAFFRFDADMVARLAAAVRANLHMPHRIVAITDLPKSALPDFVEHIDLVEHFGDLRHMGGCWLRLKCFGPGMRELLGERVAWIDLDSVVVGDLTPLFQRDEPIVLYQSNSVAGQPYNGSIVLFSPEHGDVLPVWDTFEPESASRLAREKKYRGTDQAWLAYVYGRSAPTWDWRDGILYYNSGIQHRLPPHAKLVTFPGRNKPSDPVIRWRTPWLRDLWPLPGEQVNVPSWGVDQGVKGMRGRPKKRRITLTDIRRAAAAEAKRSTR